jgi:hypothetical protein
MAFRTHHIRGDVKDHARATVQQLEALYDELAGGDEEHCKVCVSDERGRRLTIYKTGLVMLSFPKQGDPKEESSRYQISMPRAEVIGLLQALAEDDDSTVEATDWREQEPPASETGPSSSRSALGEASTPLGPATVANEEPG